jgi:hypothetical protein
MVTIPIGLRTVAGLDKKETKALVFIVQEWRRLKEKEEKTPYIRLPALDTDPVTKHLNSKHPETMKILNRFRQQGLIQLRARNSAGPSGNGWDGALFGALTPSEQAKKLVDEYLSEG